MACGFFQILLLMVVLVRDEATSRPYPPLPSSIHIHFDEDGRVFHKEGSIKLIDPISGYHHKFLPLLVSKPLKKPISKYQVGKLTDSWKALDVEKIRPALTSIPQLTKLDDDVKPVTEHIEDDIKYDFRTGQHSI